MTLPMMTTAEDVDTIVGYLKTKATGAVLADAKAALPAKVLDGRKLNAFVTWGLVAHDGGRLRLTELGRELSRASEQKKRDLYGRVLRSVEPYNAVIDWMFYQHLDQVTNVDVAAHWHEHHAAHLGTGKEKSVRWMASCFFRLCQAAGIGTLVLGRRSRPTRLEIDRENLSQFIAEAGFEGPAGGKTAEQPVAPEAVPVPREAGIQEGAAQAGLTAALSARKSRIFVSHGKNMEIVDQIKAMLEFAEFEYDIAEEEETTAIPVPEKVLTAMRRCDAAVICVTAADEHRDSAGQYAINENVLIEIGAAFVLYDRKVVLLWDKRLQIPSNLQGLYRCEFEGNELSWGIGMRLMSAVSKFKANP